jgi:hypothetical protein
MNTDYWRTDERAKPAYSVEKLEIQRKPDLSQSAFFSKVRFNSFM